VTATIRRTCPFIRTRTRDDKMTRMRHQTDSMDRGPFDRPPRACIRFNAKCLFSFRGVRNVSRTLVGYVGEKQTCIIVRWISIALPNEPIYKAILYVALKKKKKKKEMESRIEKKTEMRLYAFTKTSIWYVSLFLS